MGSHVRTNLALWQRQSREYERRCGAVLAGRRAMAWGLWRVSESRLRALGDLRDREILELGCGAARWSIALAGQGARVVGLDLSPAQLAHAARLVRRSGRAVPLVRADAEHLPFGAATFDTVFCDWGAMTFCDPLRTVPEVARVLRPGGRLVFATSSPFRNLLQHRRSGRVGQELRYDYFDLHRIDYPSEVNFQLPYGGWIRLFGDNGLEVESLTETRPRANQRTPYLTPSESKAARHWPLEAIWQVRKRPREPELRGTSGEGVPRR